MRVNAHIKFLIALAGLALLPASLLARPRKHVATPVARSTARAVRNSAHPRLVSSKHPERKQRHGRKAAPANSHRSTRHTNEGPPPSRATLNRVHTWVRMHPTESPSRANGNSKTDPADTSVAAPVTVVSVIRKTGQHPQLPSIEEVASTPEILPSLYNNRGRLVMPPPLKGSHEILLRQNQLADREGLDRVRDDDALMDMRREHTLVPLPASQAIVVDERLPANRRFCRPWAAQFLAILGRAHYARFHTPLQVNSAVRTVEFQQRLVRTNGNAAPADGDTASPHLTGQAVDLAKKGLSPTEVAWMRGYLLPLVQEGRIDVEEEFQQSCFHISIYKRYLPPDVAPNRNLALSHQKTTAALAAVLP